jgi:hypothetical protein
MERRADVQGSIPEKRGEKLYNCATVYDSDGGLEELSRSQGVMGLGFGR